MKRLLAAALLCAALPALAKEGAPKPEKDDAKTSIEKEGEVLAHILELNEDQKKKVVAIIQKDSGERQALEKKLREHERKTHEAIRVLLTDEQKEKLDMHRVQSQMRGGGGMMGGQKMRGRRMGRGGPPQGGHGGPSQGGHGGPPQGDPGGGPADSEGPGEGD